MEGSPHAKKASSFQTSKISRSRGDEEMYDEPTAKRSRKFDHSDLRYWQAEVSSVRDTLVDHLAYNALSKNESFIDLMGSQISTGMIPMWSETAPHHHRVSFSPPHQGREHVINRSIALALGRRSEQGYPQSVQGVMQHATHGTNVSLMTRREPYLPGMAPSSTFFPGHHQQHFMGQSSPCYPQRMPGGSYRNHFAATGSPVSFSGVNNMTSYELCPPAMTTTSPREDAHLVWTNPLQERAPVFKQTLLQSPPYSTTPATSAVWLGEEEVSYSAASHDSVSSSDVPDLVPQDLPVILALPEDRYKLSAHQVFLRYQIEAFKATEEDVTTHTRGRNKRIKLGQVGIRCRYCAHLPVAMRQKGSVYYPATLMGFYQAAQNMSATHLQCGLCSHTPDVIKRQFAVLMSTRAFSSGAGRPYWARAAGKLGLVDTEEGIRFVRDIQTELPGDFIGSLTVEVERNHGSEIP